MFIASFYRLTVEILKMLMWINAYKTTAHCLYTHIAMEMNCCPWKLKQCSMSIQWCPTFCSKLFILYIRNLLMKVIHFSARIAIFIPAWIRKLIDGFLNKTSDFNCQYLFFCHRLVLLRDVPILQSAKEIESFVNKNKGNNDLVFSFQKAIGTYGKVQGNLLWLK